LPATGPETDRDGRRTPEAGKGARGDWTRPVREAAPYLGLGTTLAATVLLGLGAGYWLDRRLGTEPLLFLAGGGLGIAAAGVQFFKMVSGRGK
jgi:F0F1-type ATP synthase assembly protein I